MIDGKFEQAPQPALNAINARLSDDYIADCRALIDSWQKTITRAGLDFELTLPHRAFNRNVGIYQNLCVSPAGELLDSTDWEARQGEWLPSEDDLTYILLLMRPVTEPGQCASWIAPPKKGIAGKSGDFEYVRLVT